MAIKMDAIHSRINLQIHAEHVPKEVLYSFIQDFERIERDYAGLPMKESNLLRLAAEIERLMHNPEYVGIMVKNEQIYREEEWDLDKILTLYGQHYPKRYDPEKKNYSNMEVNNMLFDLSIKGIIKGYNSPAIRYNLPSHNNKLFHGNVKVDVPLINFIGGIRYE